MSDPWTAQGAARAFPGSLGGQAGVITPVSPFRRVAPRKAPRLRFDEVDPLSFLNDGTGKVLIPSNSYAYAESGGRFLYWVLDPAGPTFTKWAADPWDPPLRVPYGQGCWVDGLPAWAMSSHGYTPELDGVWTVAEGGPLTQLFTKTNRGGGYLRRAGAVAITRYNFDDAGASTPDNFYNPITFDNTIHQYATIVIAIAIVGNGTDPVPTVTPSEPGTVLLDHISGAEPDFRSYFHVVESAPASIISWTLSDVATASWVILAHDGAVVASSADYGFGENPSPTWGSITLPNADDQTFGLAAVRDPLSWYDRPGDWNVLNDAGVGSFVDLGIFDQQPAGPTGVKTGPNADLSSWGTLTIGLSRVPNPDGSSLYTFDGEEAHRHLYEYQPDGTIDAIYSYDAAFGNPDDGRFDIHEPTSTAYLGDRGAGGAHLVTIDLLTDTGTNLGLAEDLWPALLATAEDLIWWDITCRGTDELALAFRRAGGVQAVDSTVVLARVAVADLSLIDWVEVPMNFMNPVAFDPTADGWWMAYFDSTIAAPPYLPDIYFVDVATLSTTLITTMPGVMP